jgi:hypothetical protein
VRGQAGVLGGTHAIVKLGKAHSEFSTRLDLFEVLVPFFSDGGFGPLATKLFTRI